LIFGFGDGDAVLPCVGFFAGREGSLTRVSGRFGLGLEND
jgi:hypothetical protein